MIGTPAALALSRKSPSGAVILEQTCLGSSQRALRSSTKMAVLLLSRASGFGSGRFGPSCAPAPAADSAIHKQSRADRMAMVRFSFLRAPKVISVAILNARRSSLFSRPKFLPNGTDGRQKIDLIVDVENRSLLADDSVSIADEISSLKILMNGRIMQRLARQLSFLGQSPINVDFGGVGVRRASENKLFGEIGGNRIGTVKAYRQSFLGLFERGALRRRNVGMEFPGAQQRDRRALSFFASLRL